MFASVTASKLYAEVEVIKVTVEQVQAYKQLGLKGAAAGALMQCAVTSMMILCDETAGINSRLSQVYTRGVHGNGQDWDNMGPMGFPWEWE